MIALNEIGRRIAELRGNRSQQELAEDLGISKSALSMYERGDRMPRDEVKERIAIHFNKSIQEIFFASEEHK